MNSSPIILSPEHTEVDAQALCWKAFFHVPVVNSDNKIVNAHSRTI